MRNPTNCIISDVCPLAQMELFPNQVLWESTVSGGGHGGGGGGGRGGGGGEGKGKGMEICKWPFLAQRTKWVPFVQQGAAMHKHSFWSCELELGAVSEITKH